MSSFIKQSFPKDKIVLHHTAGGYNPKQVCEWWSKQDNNISTCKVIGGLSTNPNNPTHFLDGIDTYSIDGYVVNFFDPKFYAYHLGIKEQAYQITKSSVAIELCNYGQLIKQANGTYLNYVHGIVPESQVIKLDKPFRGFEYFQSYTENQIKSLMVELLQLAEDFNIDLHLGLYALLKKGSNAFNLQSSALAGKPGLWTHVNYRKDGKWDCFPDPKLIEMILSL